MSDVPVKPYFRVTGNPASVFPGLDWLGFPQARKRSLTTSPRLIIVAT
jgi:hypothetical protein